MGRAQPDLQGLPGRPARRHRRAVAGYAFQHVSIGNPQCAIRIDDRDELERLDLQRDRPADRARRRCSPTAPTRRSGRELAPDAIRARIFERGVGETLSSGTGACGAAVAHVLRGGDSPVTVQLDGGELEVDVDESLHVDLTGWAVPVYKGELLDSVDER